ncbi:MAG: hypothetical protein IPK53_17550 [bacterium]|nr:hypothetical protein [bacterium]
MLTLLAMRRTPIPRTLHGVDERARSVQITTGLRDGSRLKPTSCRFQKGHPEAVQHELARGGQGVSRAQPHSKLAQVAEDAAPSAAEHTHRRGARSDEQARTGAVMLDFSEQNLTC